MNLNYRIIEFILLRYRLPHLLKNWQIHICWAVRKIKLPFTYMYYFYAMQLFKIARPTFI